MRLGSITRVSLAAVPIALGSCWLADFGDLSGAFRVDAGSSADVYTGVDSGVTQDARPGDGEGDFFCPSAAVPNTYCMDFDGVDAAALNIQIFGATATIVAGPSVSPPSSLSVNVSGANGYGRYEVDLPLQPTTTTLEFEIQAPGLNEGVTVLAISLEDAVKTIRNLNVIVSPYGGFELQEYFAFADGGSQMAGHGMGKLGDAGNGSTWHHAVLTLTVNDQNLQYLSGLTVDGEIIETYAPLQLEWEEGNVGLHIGVTYAQNGGPQLYFDNIRASFGM